MKCKTSSQVNLYVGALLQHPTCELIYLNAEQQLTYSYKQTNAIAVYKQMQSIWFCAWSFNKEGLN